VAVLSGWVVCPTSVRLRLVWATLKLILAAARTGILYVWSSESTKSSTTVVWPGSHRPEIYDSVIMADAHAKHHGRNSFGQLVKLNLLKSEAGARVHAEALAGARRVPVPAGALLLWDSRTTHQGWSGGPRLAQPVCWEPTERRAEEALRRKLWMCATGTPSSHSSTEGRIHGMAAKKPATPCAGGNLADGYALPLRSTLTPFPVKPGAKMEWETMLPTLWRDGKSGADDADMVAIRALLRDDVVDAL